MHSLKCYFVKFLLLVASGVCLASPIVRDVLQLINSDQGRNNAVKVGGGVKLGHWWFEIRGKGGYCGSGGSRIFERGVRGCGSCEKLGVSPLFGEQEGSWPPNPSSCALDSDSEWHCINSEAANVDWLDTFDTMSATGATRNLVCCVIFDI